MIPGLTVRKEAGRGRGLLLLLPALALLLSACVADYATMKADVNDLKQDNYKLKKDIAELRSALAAIEKGASVRSGAGAESVAAVRESQTALYTQVSDMLRELQTLNGRFEESKFFVDKELTQLGSDMEILKTKMDNAALPADAAEMRKLVTRLESIEADIALLKAKLDIKEAMPGRQEETTGGAKLKIPPGDMYDVAYKAYEAKRYGEARKRMEALVEAYPNHTLAGNALFWIGESYYQEGDYEKAILSYEDVIQKHPGHQKVPPAMLKQAYAFAELGDTKTAKGILRLLVEKFPNADAAGTAKKKLKTLK